MAVNLANKKDKKFSDDSTCKSTEHKLWHSKNAYFYILVSSYLGSAATDLQNYTNSVWQWIKDIWMKAVVAIKCIM